MNQRTIHRLESNGWAFVPTGPNEWEWRKFTETGDCCGVAGDRTWVADLRWAEGATGEDRAPEGATGDRGVPSAPLPLWLIAATMVAGSALGTIIAQGATSALRAKWMWP